MQARKKLKPGQDGTKSLLEEYGSRLFCVRYRYDEEQHLRHTTVELIVETVPWEKNARAPGFIYFIKANNGAVKIGRTKNLPARAKTFRVKLPFPISVEHYFETQNARAVEKMFHALFADRRLGGEWFDLSEEILDSIKQGAYDDLVERAERGEC